MLLEKAAPPIPFLVSFALSHNARGSAFECGPPATVLRSVLEADGGSSHKAWEGSQGCLDRRFWFPSYLECGLEPGGKAQADPAS